MKIIDYIGVGVSVCVGIVMSFFALLLTISIWFPLIESYFAQRLNDLYSREIEKEMNIDLSTIPGWNAFTTEP